MEAKLATELKQLMGKIEAIPDLKIMSCTEAGKILGKSKLEIRQLVKQGKLANYGNEIRYMASKVEVENLTNANISHN